MNIVLGDAFDETKADESIAIGMVVSDNILELPL